jgi:drug/metabolite transporter (DMT)-like permease
VWIVYLAITLFSFSSIEVFSKPLMKDVDPITLTFLRFAIGGSFLMLIVTLRKKRVKFSDLLKLILIAGSNLLGSMSFLQLSVKFSNASTAATLVATNPLFVALISSIEGKKVGFKKIVSLILGFLGVILISLGTIRGDSTTGMILGIGAAATFAVYSVFVKNYSDKYGSLTATAYTSFFSTLIYGALFEGIWGFEFPSLSIYQWLIILYLGVIVTGVAYLTFFEAAKVVGILNTSMIFFLKPVVAMVLAVFLLGERITALKALGTLVITIAIAIGK